MPVTCPNCGTQNREGNAFCASCGKPLPAAGAPPPPAPPPPGGTVPPGGGVPPTYQGHYPQGPYPPQPPYQSPYYVPAGGPPQRVHKTHWLAIVGSIVGALAVLTAVALIFFHPTPAPPPPPVFPTPTAVATATPSSGGGGPAISTSGGGGGDPTVSTNTFSVQLPAGWSVLKSDNASVLLTDANQTGLLAIDAGTVSSPTTVQYLLQALVSDWQQKFPNANPCDGSGQQTVGGASGTYLVLCFAYTPQAGSSSPAFVLLWATTSSNGSVIYRIQVFTLVNNKAFAADADQVLSSLTWTV